MVSGCQMLAVAGLSQAMRVESFSGWILDTTMFNLILRYSEGLQVILIRILQFKFMRAAKAVLYYDPVSTVILTKNWVTQGTVVS